MHVIEGGEIDIDRIQDNHSLCIQPPSGASCYLLKQKFESTS